MTQWTPGCCWLFCPADRPDRYVKALTLADVVILDLEDAVAPAAKVAARDAVRQLAQDARLDHDRTVLRVNGADTAEHRDDLDLAVAAGFRRVMLAKAEHPAQVTAIPHDVVPLLETPRGVQHAHAIAEAANVVALMWGAEDLVAGLGGSASRRSDGSYRDVARYARSRTLVAAKSAGRLAVDAVHLDISDSDGLAEECADAAAVGFDATPAIHPQQVPVIRAAYRPDPERIAWAQRLLSTVGEGQGVLRFEGRMVDGPVFRQAERILQLADEAPGSPS